MYKQVIVVNKGLNMSPGKMAAMVAHGSVAFLTEWLRQNVAPDNATFDDYCIKPTARFDAKTFNFWISGGFTKIILEVENEKELERIVEYAHEQGMYGGRDFFSIVDASTEFNDIPRWAVIAFRPFESKVINAVTGNLPLYGHGGEEGTYRRS